MSYKKPALIEIFTETYLASGTLGAGQFFDVVPKLKVGGFAEAKVKSVFIRDRFVPELVTTGPASDGSIDVEIRSGSRTLFYTIYPNEVRITTIGASTSQEAVPLEEMDLARWLDWLVGKADLPDPMENPGRHP